MFLFAVFRLPLNGSLIKDLRLGAAAVVLPALPTQAQEGVLPKYNDWPPE